MTHRHHRILFVAVAVGLLASCAPTHELVAPAVPPSTSGQRAGELTIEAEALPGSAALPKAGAEACMDLTYLGSPDARRDVDLQEACRRPLGSTEFTISWGHGTTNVR